MNLRPGCFSPQAHACDNTCTLPCGETDDDMGHRRQMKNSENMTETADPAFFLPKRSMKKKVERRYLQNIEDGENMKWLGVGGAHERPARR